MRSRSVKSVKGELIKKSREAMLAAVQIYNNPQITFKSETFITLTVIAWTYLMHSYYRGKGVAYRYFEQVGARKKYHKTKSGANKFWELERCINCDDCPLDNATKTNLRFLIGIRHEIEHQMTNKIDGDISAKLQACALNYDYYIKAWFGERYSVSKELAISIQFSAVTPEQESNLRSNSQLAKNIKNFIATFESSLSNDDVANPRYAYRVLYVPINANRKGQADSVVEFVKPGSDIAGEIERVLIKETEKNKYLPSGIVNIMQQEGFINFNIAHHTKIWQTQDGKNPDKHFGVEIANTWYWYDLWLAFVRKHCQDNAGKYR
jgi:hypothetical protein